MRTRKIEAAMRSFRLQVYRPDAKGAHRSKGATANWATNLQLDSCIRPTTTTTLTAAKWHSGKHLCRSRAHFFALKLRHTSSRWLHGSRAISFESVERSKRIGRIPEEIQTDLSGVFALKRRTRTRLDAKQRNDNERTTTTNRKHISHEPFASQWDDF